MWRERWKVGFYVSPGNWCYVKPWCFYTWSSHAVAPLARCFCSGSRHCKSQAFHIPHLNPHQAWGAGRAKVQCCFGKLRLAEERELQAGDLDKKRKKKKRQNPRVCLSHVMPGFCQEGFPGLSNCLGHGKHGASPCAPALPLGLWSCAFLEGGLI